MPPFFLFVFFSTSISFGVSNLSRSALLYFNNRKNTKKTSKSQGSKTPKKDEKKKTHIKKKRPVPFCASLHYGRRFLLWSYLLGLFAAFFFHFVVVVRERLPFLSISGVDSSPPFEMDRGGLSFHRLLCFSTCSTWECTSYQPSDSDHHQRPSVA